MCIPGSVTGDFTGDCQVEYGDLEAFTDGWQGETPTLPTPLINISAAALNLGPLSSWQNTGTLSGYFNDYNGVTDPNYLRYRPVVQNVEGKKAVTFDGNDCLVLRNAASGGSMILAPATLTSDRNEPNDFTLIAEVYNPSISTEEWYFTWARENTTDRCATFGYGTSDPFGALAHWDANDMGFGTASGRFTTPSAGNWHTVAVTYRHPQGTTDGTETVIVDGVIREIEDKDINIWQGDPIMVGNRYAKDTTTGRITQNATLGYVGSLASVKVYAGYYPPEDIAVLMGPPLDLHLPKNNVIDFKDFAVFGLKWLQPPVLFGN